MSLKFTVFQWFNSLT